MSVIVKHNYGFFSCCSVKLSKIVQYMNANKKLPDKVDSSGLFGWYKINKTGDITYDYFQHYDEIKDVKYITNLNYHIKTQFIDYSLVEYNKLGPIIKKYFTPSIEIEKIIDTIEKKYKIDYENTCVLFYRGNDKKNETKLCSYEEYTKQADLIVKKNANVKFLIQSDETEFIEFAMKKYTKSFYFKDEIRHIKKCNSTVDKVMKDKNYTFSKYYLGITKIMAKCKYIVCGSGNCSIWIMLYRENNKNVIQYLDSKYDKIPGKWISTI